MFGMQILDIAIGLVFIYLVLALTCTAINELFAGWLDRRSKNLIMGIRNMLEGSSATPGGPNDQGVVGLFYSHPLIKSLEEKGAPPSYIPSRTFALTLLDIISPATGTGQKTIADIRGAVEKLPEENGLKRSLLVMIDEAGDDLKKFQESIEVWFNNAMDRVSGWYKKRTQTIILLIAVGLVTLLNADTIRITRTLSNDKALREAFVAQAQEYVKNSQQGDNAKTPEQKVKDDLNELTELGIPLGYAGEQVPQQRKEFIEWLLSKILGLLLTAAAASLGAPFWFDVLNKFINIRAAGKSPDEVAKPPEAPPKRQEEIPPK